MKILSIAVPVYNTELYLARCLDSMLYDKKIFDDIEIIVVNDGSKDGSLAIAKQYEKNFSCIRLINKENGGHGSTINAALKIASGKYFRVVDSDDWLNMTEFPEYVKALKKVDADAVITDYRKEMAFDGEVVNFHFSKNLKFNQLYNLDKDAGLFGDGYFHMAATAFKTSCLRDADFILDEKCFYVDMEFVVFPLKTVNSFVRLDFNLYRYLIGRSEQSVNVESMFKRRADHEKVMRKLLKFYQENNFSEVKKAFVRNIIALMMSTHYYIFLHPIATRSATRGELHKFDEFLKKDSSFSEIRDRAAMHYPMIRHIDAVFFASMSVMPRKVVHRIVAIKSKERKKK